MVDDRHTNISTKSYPAASRTIYAHGAPMGNRIPVPPHGPAERLREGIEKLLLFRLALISNPNNHRS